MQPLLLGLDIGSSSVKACLVEADTGQTIASAQSPAEEMLINSPHSGWAEQNPSLWWEHTVKSIRLCLTKSGKRADQIESIGIAYQMHGLVAVDKNGEPVRPSIIWCDSRAVDIGERAFQKLGRDYCLKHFLNSPGNFTASKLRWIKENEPSTYESIHKIMLPGDFIAYKLSGEITTTDSGLSEGVFWDFESNNISESLLENYDIKSSLLANVKSVFSIQGEVTEAAAKETGLKKGTKISYRSGDQPNNAFSLNVLKPGETAATAGTSGVIYSVTDKNAFDIKSRVNTFLHVNNKAEEKRNGVLLCLNGSGILNSWLRKNLTGGNDIYSYQQMNEIASRAPIGAEGLTVLPFGNGAERILENKTIDSSFHGLNFNKHNQTHLLRASQEGIVFALRYGFEILQSMGMKPTIIRAGHANMFLSPLFTEAFTNTIGLPIELYNTDGAKGAAIGSGIGVGVFHSFEEAFKGLKIIHTQEPKTEIQDQYNHAYEKWKSVLNKFL
jgi:xylulokinase